MFASLQARQNYHWESLPDMQGRIFGLGLQVSCNFLDKVMIFLAIRNVKLLQHFIDPYTGQTLPTSKTNICQKQFRLLDIEVERAKDHGLIEVDVPQVEYDYELYKKQG